MRCMMVFTFASISTFSQKHDMFSEMRVAVLTVSDSCSRGEAEDKWASVTDLKELNLVPRNAESVYIDLKMTSSDSWWYLDAGQGLYWLLLLSGWVERFENKTHIYNIVSWFDMISNDIGWGGTRAFTVISMLICNDNNYLYKNKADLKGNCHRVLPRWSDCHPSPSGEILLCLDNDNNNHNHPILDIRFLYAQITIWRW